MGTKHILSRKEACRYLGIAENATDEEVKRAYRLMAKQYHPDANVQIDTREVYFKIQEAYEFLMTHPYVTPMVRQPRIFQTDMQVREQYSRQKRYEEERKKALQREESIRKQAQKASTAKQSQTQAKTKEEEALEKIRAIWLAETIHRQIEQDKEKKEAENRRKLYQAFMQQRINEEEEQKQEKSLWRKL